MKRAINILLLLIGLSAYGQTVIDLDPPDTITSGTGQVIDLDVVYASGVTAFVVNKYNVGNDGSAWEDVGIEITLSGSQTGVDYVLQKRSGANFINKDTLAGTGSALSFGNYDSTGTYKIHAYYLAVDSLMTDSAVIAIRYYNTDAKALFARMTTQPSNVRKQLYSLTIDSLDTYGIWDKGKIMYFFAAGNRQISLLNWISTSFNCDTVGTRTFTADSGWAGNGTNGYLNTGWKDLTNSLSTDNSSWAIWIAKAGTASATKYAFGTQKSSTAIDRVGLVNYSTTSDRAVYFGDSVQYNAAGYAGDLGLFANTNKNATNDTVYWVYNGGILSKAKTLVRGNIAHDYNIYIGANNAYSSANGFQNQTTSFFLRSTALTITEHAKLYTIVKYFLDNIGSLLAFEPVEDAVYDDYLDRYLTVGNITDATKISAITYLYNAYHDSSLWDLKYAIYPMPGNDVVANCLNLKKPFQSNDSLNLSVIGTITNNANGMTSNPGLVNTHFIPSEYDKNDMNISFYSGTNAYDASNFRIDFGATDGTNPLYLGSYPVIGINNLYGYMKNRRTHVNKNTKGYYTLDQDASRLRYAIDGVITENYLNNPSAVPSTYLYMMGYNSNGTAGAYDYRNCKFAAIGKSMTEEQIWTESQIVKTYQTMLSRADTVKGRYVGRETKDYPVALYDSGDYYPKKGLTTRLQEFTDMDVGALICFNARTWAYSTTSPTSPKNFYCPNVDVGAWVRGMDTMNIDYAVLTIMEESGFSLEPYAQPTHLADQYAQFRKFDIQNSYIDTNIVSKFVDSCTAHSIVPIAYICPVKIWNYKVSAGLHTYMDSTDITIYNNWMASYIQNLISKYNFKYIWLDNYYGYYEDTESKQAVCNFRMLYDAVKAMDTTCLVIAHGLGDVNLQYFPYDIGANEEYYSFGAETEADYISVGNPLRTLGDTTYYIPQEFVTNIKAGGSPVSYYAETPPAEVACKTLSEVQDFYDKAKAQNANFLLSLIPDRNGVINSCQWEIFDDLSY